MIKLRSNVVIFAIFVALLVTNNFSNLHQSELFAKTKDEISGYSEIGTASWYGPGFQGRKTASGEVFNTHDLTAAHKTLPFGTLLKVTNLSNNLTVVVRVNDRGPFIKGRIIDLSYAAKTEIGIDGIAPVRIEAIDPESELSSSESEIEGFETENLFEDVSMEKFNNLNDLYTFKKVSFNLLTSNNEDVNSIVYKKLGETETNNSSELPLSNVSGYTIKIAKSTYNLSTKEVIAKLESIGYRQIFIQVLTGKNSTAIYVMTGIYTLETDAAQDLKELEKRGFSVKLIKVGN